MSETNNEVVWERMLRVKATTTFGDESPRTTFARVFKQGDHIVIAADGAEFSFSPEAIEAIYDLHQDVPR